MSDHQEIVRQLRLCDADLAEESADLIESLAKDAERYRWLRSSRDSAFWTCHEKDGEGGQILKYGIDLDVAIDEARKA
jgi:hypothetical protein